MDEGVVEVEEVGGSSGFGCFVKLGGKMVIFVHMQHMH